MDGSLFYSSATLVGKGKLMMMAMTQKGKFGKPPKVE